MRCCYGATRGEERGLSHLERGRNLSTCRFRLLPALITEARGLQDPVPVLHLTRVDDTLAAYYLSQHATIRFLLPEDHDTQLKDGLRKCGGGRP